jgi:hypothetical protein
MANRTQSTFAKRQKELARQARQKDKQAKRLEAKQQKAAAGEDPTEASEAEDPDLVGIRLGPQPIADEDENEREQ